MDKELKVKKTKKPTRPIKLCLTAEQGKPCKWMVKEKRYTCHSGTLMCPLMRSPRFCRLYAVYVLKDLNTKKEIRGLYKERAYFIWTGKAFRQRADKTFNQYASQAVELEVEEEGLLQKAEDMEKELLETYNRITKIQIKRSLPSAKMKTVDFYNEKKKDFFKKAKYREFRINQKTATLGRKYKGFDQLAHDKVNRRG